MDKLLIKVCKSNEWLHVLHTGRDLPLLNGVNFVGVYANPIACDNKTWVIHLSGIEFTFLDICL